MKTALITGITGQDGSYLAELLLQKGYTVHGLLRRSSTENTERIDPLVSQITLHYGDITDSLSVLRVLEAVRPDELYHLAAQSHVHTSFDMPEYTAQTDAIGTLRVLETVRLLGLDCRVYQASTSELYGAAVASPQNEETPFRPRSPYAIAKQYAYWTVRCYREAYGLFAVNGILFNHESERRGLRFVTRKITRGVAALAAGAEEPLRLGNLNALRDWGYAPDYVECMWRMLQHPVPDDFVVAAGVQHSIKDFCTLAFTHAGFDLVWRGAGTETVGLDQKSGRTLVVVDPAFYRPLEVESLLGDATKARRVLGWEPRTDFAALVARMTDHDLGTAKL
ncbi:MAG: GDP-mannose 4,6-dehydratase [Oscillospiraceae bacterium]|nr:GDP-mannose 4,6-dehydratase [Oscillospiraceae bacterium]